MGRFKLKSDLLIHVMDTEIKFKKDTIILYTFIKMS